MTYTDTQLKQALAKMLPENVIYHAGFKTNLGWSTPNLVDVLDTELLHLCWLVEESLEFHDRDIKIPLHEANWISRYKFELIGQTNMTVPYHASWQQRTIALAKVKSVDIV